MNSETEQRQHPGRDEKQPSGSKRLTVMVAGVGHAIEVQPGTLTTDVLAQVGAAEKKLSKTQGPGKGFAASDRVFESVNDQDTLYVT